MSKNKEDVISFSLTYNEDLTSVGLVIKADSPISEEEFMACLYDFYVNNGDLDFNASGDKVLASGGYLN